MTMNIDTPHTQPETRRNRLDTHVIQTFTEYTHPTLVDEARRVHALGYIHEGFVINESLTADGYLPDDIDKARGDTVEYFLASSSDSQHPDNLTSKATMRLISIPEGETVESLPAYKLCKDTVSSKYLDYLQMLPAENVKEMGALARTADSSPMAAFELFRHALHTAKPGDVWFFTVVSTTHASLLGSFGPHVVRTIGDPIELDDPRVGNDVRLVPAITHTDTFIDDIRIAAEETSDPLTNRRLLRTFMFFSEGLTDEELSQESADLRSLITNTATHSS